MTKSQRKAQEGHIEEGEATSPTKGTKTVKPRKEQEKLKICAPPESTLSNTLNASSPP
jgi:hypothetical protein